MRNATNRHAANGVPAHVLATSAHYTLYQPRHDNGGPTLPPELFGENHSAEAFGPFCNQAVGYCRNAASRGSFRLSGQGAESEWRKVESSRADAVLRDVESQWNAQRTQIQTAHLTYALLEGRTRRITDDELMGMLSIPNVLSSHRHLQVLSEKLRRPLKDGRSRQWDVAHMELWQEGGRTREENNAGAVNTVEIVDGDNRLDYLSYTSQASVAHSANTPIVQASASRYYYRPPRLDPASLLRIEEYNHKVRLTIGASRGARSLIDVDTGTGGVLSVVSYSPAERIRYRIFQAGLEIHNGVLFPKVYAKFSYVDGLLHNMIVARFSDVEFNGAVPETVFTLDVPRGTVLADLRADSPRGVRVKSDVKDVLEFVDSTVAANDSQSEYRRGTTPFIIVAFGVGLLAVLLLMRRRVRLN